MVLMAGKAKRRHSVNPIVASLKNGNLVRVVVAGAPADSNSTGEGACSESELEFDEQFREREEDDEDEYVVDHQGDLNSSSNMSKSNRDQEEEVGQFSQIITINNNNKNNHNNNSYNINENGQDYCTDSGINTTSNGIVIDEKQRDAENTKHINNNNNNNSSSYIISNGQVDSESNDLAIINGISNDSDFNNTINGDYDDDSDVFIKSNSVNLTQPVVSPLPGKQKNCSFNTDGQNTRRSTGRGRKASCSDGDRNTKRMNTHANHLIDALRQIKAGKQRPNIKRLLWTMNK